VKQGHAAKVLVEVAVWNVVKLSLIIAGKIRSLFIHYQENLGIWNQSKFLEIEINKIHISSWNFTVHSNVIILSKCCLNIRNVLKAMLHGMPKQQCSIELPLTVSSQKTHDSSTSHVWTDQWPTQVRHWPFKQSDKKGLTKGHVCCSEDDTNRRLFLTSIW